MYENSAASNYNNIAVTEVRTTEVQTEINRIIEVSDHLDKCVADLESKLVGVLAQHKVAGTDAQTAPSPLRVPLAEALHTRGDHLEVIRQRVSSMISRLEI